MKKVIALLFFSLLFSGFANGQGNTNKLKKEIYSAAGTLETFYTYEYTNQGKSKKSHFDSDGKLLRYFTYTYYDVEKKNEKLEHGPDGALLSVTRYDYDG